LEYSFPSCAAIILGKNQGLIELESVFWLILLTMRPSSHSMPRQSGMGWGFRRIRRLPVDGLPFAFL
jgi:hypothetical protein